MSQHAGTVHGVSRRSWVWWTVAFAAPLVSFLPVLPSGYAWVYAGRVTCPAHEALLKDLYPFLEVVFSVPLMWYCGLPAVATAAVAAWAANRWGRPRWGRVTTRILALAVLLSYIPSQAGRAIDTAIDADCLARWGGTDALFYDLLGTGPALVAACALLAAARVPRDRSRRSWPRRTAATLVPFTLLLLLPAADSAAEHITPAAECEEFKSEWHHRRPSGEREFLCFIRQAHPDLFGGMPDRQVLVYGRRLCAIRTGDAPDTLSRQDPRLDAYHMSYSLAALCPDVAALVDREERERKQQEQRELAARKAEERRRCRAAHRRTPRIKPVQTVEKPVWTAYGVMDAYETEEVEEPPTGDDRLVDTRPGAVYVYVHADRLTCVTAETYRRRPPAEPKGWDRVVEIGYTGPTGKLEFQQGSGYRVLPNLLVDGEGRYRLRVHHRGPDREDVQRLLIQVFPAKTSKRSHVTGLRIADRPG